MSLPSSLNSTPEPGLEFSDSPQNQLGYFFEYCHCIRSEGHNPETCAIVGPTPSPVASPRAAVHNWSDIDLFHSAQVVQDVDPYCSDCIYNDPWAEIALWLHFEDVGPDLVWEEMDDLFHANQVSCLKSRLVHTCLHCWKGTSPITVDCLQALHGSLGAEISAHVQAQVENIKVLACCLSPLQPTNWHSQVTMIYVMFTSDTKLNTSTEPIAEQESKLLKEHKMQMKPQVREGEPAIWYYSPSL